MTCLRFCSYVCLPVASCQPRSEQSIIVCEKEVEPCRILLKVFWWRGTRKYIVFVTSSGWDWNENRQLLDNEKPQQRLSRNTASCWYHCLCVCACVCFVMWIIPCTESHVKTSVCTFTNHLKRDGKCFPTDVIINIV